MRILFLVLFLCLFACNKKQTSSAPPVEAPPTGRQLFAKYCSPCHSPHSLKMMSPAFATVQKNGKAELLYNFLQNKKNAQTDTAFIRLTLGKSYHVISFPDITLVQLQAMIVAGE